MTEQIQNLGKLESVHGVSPVYLQRALIVIILSFIFFMAMLIAFSLRMQVGYFLLATAFLIVNLFTLFGFMMQRKKTVGIYENGFTFGKKVHFFKEIKEIQHNEITKNDGEKIILPKAIDDFQTVRQKIFEKLLASRQSIVADRL